MIYENYRHYMTDDSHTFFRTNTTVVCSWIFINIETLKLWLRIISIANYNSSLVGFIYLSLGLISPFVLTWLVILTLWGRDEIAQTTFWNEFSSLKMFEFWLKFHWSLILRVQRTIFQRCFRLWLGADQLLEIQDTYRESIGLYRSGCA